MQVAPRPNTFVPFGLGVHACPGNELAKLEMLILIHHLVTEFRYKFTLTTASSSLRRGTETSSNTCPLNIFDNSVFLFSGFADGKSWALKMGFNTAHSRCLKKDSRLDFGKSPVGIANSILTNNLSES